VGHPLAPDRVMSATHEAAPLLARLRDIPRQMAIQDYVATTFHTYMLLRVLLAPTGPQTRPALLTTATLFAVTVGTVILVRGKLLPGRRVPALLYRLGIFSPVVLSYLTLRHVLPALQLPLQDATLLAIDRRVLGESPAVWMERLSTHAVVEWFSFFYYSYIWILGVAMVPFLLFDRGARMRELFIGAMVVACAGHVGYTLVPAVGPCEAMRFAAPLAGGFWWSKVEVLVSGSGAMMDVFPSLHTAFPSFFTLHAIGHRRTWPHRYTWPVFLFFTLNIIVSTMLLRWHYAVDVAAGLALATTARLLAIKISRREARRGIDDDRQPVWLPLWP